MNTLNLYGPLNNLGYGVVTRGLIKGLLQNRVSAFSLVPIGHVQIDDPSESAFVEHQLKNYSWDRKAPSVAVWHENDLNKFSANKLVALPIFETTGFHQISLNYLNQMDLILVLSNWAKTVVESNLTNKVPVSVVQGATDLFEPESVLNMTRNSNSFTFLTVGKLEHRKSQVEAIRAYVNAFANKPDSNTRLICHCFNPFDNNFVNNVSTLLSRIGLDVIQCSTVTGSIIAKSGNALIEVPKGPISREQLFQLYRYCHVGVFPSKAEGWNLPLMEAIKSNLPCIATNYSAHTEYLTDEYNYPKELLLYHLQEQCAVDNVFFKGDRGNWVLPNLDELSEKMLYCYNNYDRIVNSFNPSKIKEHFTWKNSAGQLLDALKQL